MTVSREVSGRQLEAFARFLKMLPHGKDTDLVLLKGHILIEEQVRLLIDRRLRNPVAIVDGRLECHQCICLAQSFFPHDFEPWLWSALKKLNKMRNDIAHQSDPTGLQDRIDAWVASVPSGLHDHPNKMERFELTLWSLFDAVSELVDSSLAQVIPLSARV